MKTCVVTSLAESRKSVEDSLTVLQQMLHKLCQETGAYKTCPYVQECRTYCKQCPLQQPRTEKPHD